MKILKWNLPKDTQSGEKLAETDVIIMDTHIPGVTK